MKVNRIDASWLQEQPLQRLMAALNTDGEEARIAGGAVRNSLLGYPVSDIDIATTTLPDETIRRARAAGFKVAMTGYEHGTITVIGNGSVYEVTTLRADIETDGRHAKVCFGTDWLSDANRRDFTINALYADAQGNVIDLIDGLKDLESRTIRFIGDANERIEEDYLRILRFFRFFAIYGHGRPDADGIRACVRHRDNIQSLSAERIWSEFKKLLRAKDPARALLWMRQTGVLTKVLPESEKWGIDTIHVLVEAEQAFGWEIEPLLRLAAIIPPDAKRIIPLSQRLRLSKKEANALSLWAETPMPDENIGESAFTKLLYKQDVGGAIWRLKLALANLRAKDKEAMESLEKTAKLQRLLSIAQAWQRPKFPLSGQDLMEQGFQAGPEIGTQLEQLEQVWIESRFQLSRDELMAEAAKSAPKV